MAQPKPVERPVAHRDEAAAKDAQMRVPKPAEREPDYEALRKRIVQRFPKTLAYLAK